MTASDDQPKELTDLMDDIDAQAQGESELCVSDLMDAFGSRGFGPLLAVPALLAISPVGAIPGVPAVLAVLVVLVAGQHLIGMDHPWVPKRLATRSVSTDRWEAARDRFKPWAKRIDKLIRPRLTWLTQGVMDRGLSVIAIGLAVLMVPLELLPFAVMAPGAALLLLGLALSARDGLLALIGLALTAASAAMLFWVL